MYLLIMESSTTSAKAMLYDPVEGAVEVRSETYPSEAMPGETGTQDAKIIFERTMALGKEIAQGKEIAAVIPCGTWHNVLVCDKDMVPKAPALTWTYNGAAPAAAELRKSERFTREFYRRTGCMVHAIYPTFKLLQLRQEGMDLTDTLISSQGSYTFYRLTGERFCSDCTASGSGLLNVHTRQWDPEALALAGIREEQLGRVVSYKEHRPLSVEGAELLGLKPGIPVLPAHPDGALNQVGAGALESGVMTFSVGTSGALRLSASTPVLPEVPSTWCYLSPDGWISGAATSGACNCVDWAKDSFFPPETSYEELEALEADEEHMPIFLPFLFGERCPGWHDEWQGGFAGLLSEHTSADLYRSVQEGVLFNLYQCYQVLCALNGVPKTIQLSGGILNSPAWRQTCCDLFGRELQCSEVPHASMMGGAVLGLETIGAIGSIQDFKAEPTEVLVPDGEHHRKLEERFKRYLEEYSRLGGTQQKEEQTLGKNEFGKGA